MTERGRIIDGARAVARSASFGLYCAGLLASFELHHRAVAPEARIPLMLAYRRRAVADWVRLFGLDIRTLGQMPITGSARLIVANHQSALDILVMVAQFGGILLSRHDLASWPLVGRLAQHSQTIFVDRDDPVSGLRAIRRIRRRLAEGETVIVFPEGRTHAGEVVQTFYPGLFSALRGLSVEVVPVGLVYRDAKHYVDRSFVTHLLELAASPRREVFVAIGDPEPCPPRAKEAAEQLRARVQAQVDRAVHERDSR